MGNPSTDEARICGHGNRLTGDEVRQVRLMKLTGRPLNDVVVAFPSKTEAQLAGVYDNKSYTRVPSSKKLQ